jgi:hypothetical protein
LEGLGGGVGDTEAGGEVCLIRDMISWKD